MCHMDTLTLTCNNVPFVPEETHWGKQRCNCSGLMMQYFKIYRTHTRLNIILLSCINAMASNSTSTNTRESNTCRLEEKKRIHTFTTYASSLFEPANIYCTCITVRSKSVTFHKLYEIALSILLVIVICITVSCCTEKLLILHTQKEWYW